MDATVVCLLAQDAGSFLASHLCSTVLLYSNTVVLLHCCTLGILCCCTVVLLCCCAIALLYCCTVIQCTELLAGHYAAEAETLNGSCLQNDATQWKVFTMYYLAQHLKLSVVQATATQWVQNNCTYCTRCVWRWSMMWCGNCTRCVWNVMWCIVWCTQCGNALSCGWARGLQAACGSSATQPSWKRPKLVISFSEKIRRPWRKK